MAGLETRAIFQDRPVHHKRQLACELTPPEDPVAGLRVAPVQIAPALVAGIVLVEAVVLAVLVAGAVRVVHPAGAAARGGFGQLTVRLSGLAGKQAAGSSSSQPFMAMPRAAAKAGQTHGDNANARRPKVALGPVGVVARGGDNECEGFVGRVQRRVALGVVAGGHFGG